MEDTSEEGPAALRTLAHTSISLISSASHFRWTVPSRSARMIIDEKIILHYPPPPSYWSATDGLPSFNEATGHRYPCSLSNLPPQILLNIIFISIASPANFRYEREKREAQRKALLWLHDSLRLVDRALYVSCMHLLRSTYLPLYESNVKLPFSSDPFPFLQEPGPSHTASGTRYPLSPLNVLQRETAILDRFIALKVREDVLADESAFHNSSSEATFRDIFDFQQPKARLEDLVREYGAKKGVVAIPGQPQPTLQRVPERRYTMADEDSMAEEKEEMRRSTISRTSTCPSTTDTYTSTSRLDSTSRRSSSFSLRSLFPGLRKPKSRPHLYPYIFDENIGPRASSQTLARTASSQTLAPPRPPPPPRVEPLPFASLSISLSSRSVGLLHSTTTSGGIRTRRTVVNVERRNRIEDLEVSARRLVRELRKWREDQ